MTTPGRPTVPGLTRRTALAAALAAVAGLTTACSGDSTADAKSTARTTDDATALDAIIAAHEPANASDIPNGSTAAEIKSRGKLLVGGTQTAALFSLLDPTTQKLSGFDAAMSQLLAKYIIGEPKTELINVTAATREALLKNHTVDAVFATYTITPEREKKVNFAGPYYMDGLGIQVKKNNTGISTLNDLAGKTVVTQSGSTAATIVKGKVPSVTIQLFDTNVECLQALQQGRADAYVLDQGVLAGNALRSPDVKVLSGTFSKEPYGIGLPLDQPEFKEFVNNWLVKIEVDGTWAKVWKATIGTQVPGAVPMPPKIG